MKEKLNGKPTRKPTSKMTSKMTRKLAGMAAIGIAVLLVGCGSDEQRPAPPGGKENATGGYAAERTSYDSLYRTSVFLGDSITEGLSYHDVLKEEHVLAGAGKTAQFALKDVAELVKRKPKHIMIQLGSDDILWPVDNPMEDSLSHYAQLIADIRAGLPDASITLLSVTPVTAKAEKAEPRYRNIGEYNEGLKQLAAREGVGYIDLSPLAAAHPDLYGADGIHFQASFYPLLLDFLQDKL